MMITSFLFLIGIFVGSFLNVLIDRIPRDESFISGRSHCDFCQHPLAWYDLIPLFSFIFLKGKCRYCKKFIGFKYPIIELTTGVSYVGVYIFLSMNYELLILNLLYYLFLFSCLIVIFFTDLFYEMIPDKVLFPLTFITFIYIILNTKYLILSNILCGLGACGLFLFLLIITKGRGMGFGDVKFAFFLGLLLGWPNTLLALYLAFLTGAVIALILVMSKKKRFFGGTIPFGPFLIIGLIISLIWGNTLWHIVLTVLA